MIVRFLKNYFFSRDYMKAKKEGYVADIYVPEWRASLYERDVGSYRIRFDLGNGHQATAMVIQVDHPGQMARGVHLNLEYIDDEKYIVHCSLFEFVEKYLPTINYLITHKDGLDILQIKEVNKDGETHH